MCFRLTPVARAMATLLVTGGISAWHGLVAAQSTPVSGAWFAAQGAVQRSLQGARAPMPRTGAGAMLNAGQQQAQARAQLARSVDNLGRTAAAIAAQQAAQLAARAEAANAVGVPDGLVRGGLWDRDTAGNLYEWKGADRPVYTPDGDQHNVAIKQTDNKAVLNWETFNVGRNTTVDFQQKPTDAVLNRVIGAEAAPSQIQGAIRGDGTVMVVNQNGVIFSDTSQVNVRNLVVAATEVDIAHFNDRDKGLYGDGLFKGAKGKVQVERGAQINTNLPASNSNNDGGYVLLLGSEVHNAGQINTPKGQTVLAAGDSFIIKKGVSTDGNPASTIAGNEVEARFNSVTGGTSGKVVNTGLITASTGDVTLTGRDITQAGVIVTTTSQAKRGTVHLKTDNTGTITIREQTPADVAPDQSVIPYGGTTAIALDSPEWVAMSVTEGHITMDQGRAMSDLLALNPENDAMAVDSQREGLQAPYNLNDAINKDKTIIKADTYRRDLSLIQIDAGAVDFQSKSLTLATGGQIAVNASQRALVREGAELDVSGAIGVKMAMDTNNVRVNIQGNEMRDAPVNRDSDKENKRSYLSSLDVWVDRRRLVLVEAEGGAHGYDSDRWYTAGGLLEVSGYLGTEGRSISEWMAQGGTVSFTGNDVVTLAGSHINLSGGTLDVQSGYLNQSWLRGADGRLYVVDNAPGDLLYLGQYKGYEQHSERWGVTRTFYNHMLAPTRRYEDGYTVGRDAGTLVIGTRNAVLSGDIIATTYQGARQIEAPKAGLDSLYQSHNAIARRGQLVVGSYTPYYVKNATGNGGTLQYGLDANANTIRRVVLGDTDAAIAAALEPGAAVAPEREGELVLDAKQLGEFGLGRLKIAAEDSIVVDKPLTMVHGGEITLYATEVNVNADIVAHGGALHLGNVLNQISSNDRVEDDPLSRPTATSATPGVTVAEGVRLDVSGLWSNLQLNPVNMANLPYQNGGSVSVRSTGNVLLQAGSQINVSSGALADVHGNVKGGRGGSVTLGANAATTSTAGIMQLAGDVVGYGVQGGGTLHILAGKVHIGRVEDAVDPEVLQLSTDLFQKGFSNYVVIGNQTLTVAENTQLDVAMPVYQVNDNSRTMATGMSVQDVLTLWTPPLYQEDPVAGVLSQRAGASLTLQAGTVNTAINERNLVQLQLAQGSQLNVDPGQSIALRSAGQLTVDGVMNAWGGKITLGVVDARVDPAGHGRSVWLGDNAVLDVAGRAVTAVDQSGNRYGRVDAGGEITIGGVFDHNRAAVGETDRVTGVSNADDVFIVVREGARLDASGSSAVLDIPGRGAVSVAESGGSISLASSNGLYIDGTLIAQAGGTGAAGGRLTIALDTPFYRDRDAKPRVRSVARELVLTSEYASTLALDDTDPAVAADQLTYGFGRIAVSQVEVGGFDTVTLASDGILSFAGDVDLSVGHQLSLYSNVLHLRHMAPEQAQVRLSAPYIRLHGYDQTPTPQGMVHPTIRGGGGASGGAVAGKLTVEAGQLLELGGIQSISTFGSPSTGDDMVRRAFADVALASGADMRFLGGPLGGEFRAPGSLRLAAAQLYPVTNANAEVHAATLDIERTTDHLPNVPYSAFGSLSLVASQINQGGVVRAPLGQIILGDSTHVNLLEHSVTSVSAQGLIMPFGGTSDGEVWRYAGNNVSLIGSGSWDDARIELIGRYVDVHAGAIIDVSGGGTLTGAGFVSGRGGSTDARHHPLVQITDNGFVLPGLDTNPIYAIVPGVQMPAAPHGSESGASQSLIGEQIFIEADGIPGLQPGFYTLLPSHYALLPGAYRVEVNRPQGSAQVLDRVVTLRNGSYAVSGLTSIQGTEFHRSLAQQLILTPADTLRTYSQYNETSYSDFVRADAARLGVPRAVIEADGKNLILRALGRDKADDEAISLSFAGQVMGSGAEGGRGSTMAIIGDGGFDHIEILDDTGRPDENFSIALRASDLNRMDVSRLVIGGLPGVPYGQGANMVLFGSQAAIGVNRNPVSGVTVRSGVMLEAPEILLVSRGGVAPNSGLIEVEQGAVINTLGQGQPAFTSADGFIYQPADVGVLAVSNTQMRWLAPQATENSSPSIIRVGTCSSGNCDGATGIYSEGSIAFVTSNEFELDDTVRYGTRHLSIAVGAFNIGDASALASAGKALTPGLTLNAQVMQDLLQGSTYRHDDMTHEIPPLETLELIASQSVNFFGDISLSTMNAQGQSLLDNLMLTSPAIYGYGQKGEVARIQTKHLIWNGATQAPGVIANGGAGTGSGTFQVDAERITLGYGAYGQPDGVSTLDRLMLGFGDVKLTASDRMTANNAGSLSIYQSHLGYDQGKGDQYAGGNLEVITPLWTGEPGSVSKITAGGAITINAPETGAADPSGIEALGAELSLTAGQGITLDTAVVLPSGKLTLNAQHDIVLGAQSHLDLSGRTITFFDDADATQYSWGGDITLESEQGNITQAASSVINLSATNNQAGRLTATALASTAGMVDLQGRILGSASGYYEAGGTWVPYLAGGVNVRAQTLGASGTLSEQFAAFNVRLNDGQVVGLRSFQFKQGNLTIHDGLNANQIEVSLDGGDLTVAGTVDASGERVGSIRLAAKRGLTIAGNAVLDTHGSILRLDSYGKIIDAPNRAIIELNSGEGVLTLADGARMDLRHGTADVRVQATPALHDGRALGTVLLYAPRMDAAGQVNTGGAAIAGDVAIEARSALTIEGARAIALHAMQRYADAPEGTDTSVSGRPYQLITQAYLDGKHADGTTFITNAHANDNLLNNKLSGLNNAAYRNVFHLRPGVEIVSATPDGDLVVSGDLDLSGHRYASLNPTVSTYRVGAMPGDSDYGYGEPGALILRAGGDLNIYGSINDGFVPPPETPDDNGWVLTPGIQGFGGDVVIPIAGVSLAKGTEFPAGKTLNYAAPLDAMTLPVGTVLPTAVTLDAALLLPIGTVISADIHDAAGNPLASVGDVLKEALSIPVDAVLGAGMRVTPEVGSIKIKSVLWPANTPIPVTATLANHLELPLGAVIPSMTKVQLVGDVPSVPLRPTVDGRMGRNWAVAAMLPEGNRLSDGSQAKTQSWNMRLVAGSDMASADARVIRTDNAGNIVMADSHYGIFEQYDTQVIPGTPPVVVYKYTELAALFGYTPGERVPDDLVTLLNCAVPGNGFCIQIELSPGTPDQIVPGEVNKVTPASQIFSVLRTGTGDLDLISSGDVSMQSPYGVYTAGVSTASRLGDQQYKFNQPREKQSDGTYLKTGFSRTLPEGKSQPGPIYESLINGSGNSTYAAWYPDGGGNLLIKTGGDLTGDITSSYNPAYPSDDLRSPRSTVDIGNWLWRQSSLDGNMSTKSWWINFGTYVPGPSTVNSTISEQLSPEEKNAVPAIPELIGFTGIGTLGGGNINLQVGGNAGIVNQRGNTSNPRETQQRSEGIVVVVGNTVRMLNDEILSVTGGGDLIFHMNGGLNVNLVARTMSRTPDEALSRRFQQNINLNGLIGNLRGDIGFHAGNAGGVALNYYQSSSNLVDLQEVRAFNPYVASVGAATGGPVLMLGDAVARLNVLGDIVVSGNADPGLVSLPYTTPLLTPRFSLWTDNTAVELITAGGNAALGVQIADINHIGVPFAQKNHSPVSGRYVWPGQMSIVSANGSLYFGKSALGLATTYNASYSMLLTSSDNGKLDILAGDSIYGSGYSISRSSSSESSIDRPGVIAAQNPIRVYAKQGDIVGLNTGEIVEFSATDARDNLYLSSGPLRMMAGQDIVRSGTLEGSPTPINVSGATGATSRGNLIIHQYPHDVSVISAGRDILYSTFNILGPGTLEVMAGRNLRQENRASITSLRPQEIGDPRQGADIVIQAGVGPGGVGLRYQDLLARYLSRDAIESIGHFGLTDPDPAKPLVDQPGTVLRTYDELTLEDWLRSEYGYRGEAVDGSAEGFLANLQSEYSAANPNATRTLREVYQEEASSDAYLVNWLANRYDYQAKDANDAIAYFNALAPEQQRIFARNVYFAELRAAGREYNNTLSPRAGNYLRGRNVISSLLYAPILDSSGKPLPVWGADGEFAVNAAGQPFYQPYAYSGDVIVYQGSEHNGSIRTLGGGSIDVLTPGGAQTYGVEGIAPASGPDVTPAGVLTQGQGDIRMFSQGSILLGLSRIMTAAGGDIFGWTTNGDINAGRGSKTTLVYAPPLRVYDAFGNVTVTPDIPATGAGIATLNDGDVDLIAPLGTIDAGEAGIRVAGSINVAALQVVNADNIQVQGEATGIPVAVAVNTAALTQASSAATSAATAAQETVQRARAEARQNLPSIITVRILGFGNEPAEGAPVSVSSAPVQITAGQPYRPDGLVQVASPADLSAQERAQLGL